MESLLKDLRYALRTLIRRPGFTAVALLTLALGIGANTAIFSVVNAVLLRPLPFGHPENLVLVWGDKQGIGHETASFPDFQDWKAQNRVFDDMAAVYRSSLNLTGGGIPERLIGGHVSAGFFLLLGISPALGRNFHAGEDSPAAATVVILSHGLWQRRFGSNSQIVGQKIVLDGKPCTVVGVAPADLYFPNHVDLWMPLALDEQKMGRRNDFLLVIARLKSGVSLDSAQSEMKAIAAGLEQEYPRTNSGWTVALVPLREQIVGKLRPALLVLLGAVGMVLLIGCVNLSNLLLARGVSRRGEMTLRAVLGADRIRLARQLLSENLLLAFLGGTAGLLLCLWGIPLLVKLAPAAIPRLSEVQVDRQVLLFTLGISMLAGLVFGLFPSLGSTPISLSESLNERHGHFGSKRGSSMRNGLIVAEVSLAVVLLCGAGLFLRSLLLLRSVDPGFQTRQVMTLRLQLPRDPSRQPEQTTAFYQTLLQQVRTLPSVQRAAVVGSLPFGGGEDFLSFTIQGRPPVPAAQVQDARVTVASADYLKTLEIPLLKGRAFDRRDRSDSIPVAIINQSFARRYWPGGNPVGSRISINDPPRWRTIIGISGNVKHQSLAAADYPEMYLPLTQAPARGMTLLAKTRPQAPDYVSAVRQIVRRLDPALPLYSIHPLDQMVSSSLDRQRFQTLLLGLFALLALTLSAVGIYGVISFSVLARSHEIGVRLALGANPSDVLKDVLAGVLKLALLGIAVGVPISVAVSRTFDQLLYRVGTTDPWTLTLVPMLLLSIALLAGLIPALKASRVDPLVTLRYE